MSCAALAFWLACGHSGSVSPAPLVEPPPGTGGVPSQPALAGEGWSFEAGLDGWQLDVGPAQPVCDPVLADRLGAAGGTPPVTLAPPGDYWRTPIALGEDGRCRIDTAAAGPGRTVLHSADLQIDAPYLRFRVGGGGRSGTSVALGQSGAASAPLFVEHGPGTLGMHEVVWDLRALRGQVARLTIEDDGASAGGILVDAFRFLPEDPGARPAPLWGFADLHSHPGSELGFGGNFFYGSVDGAIEGALGRCDRLHGLGGIGGQSGPLMAFFEQSLHGGPGHRTTGSPQFDGWPRWTTQAHQQMHVDWIRRAWQGGLRLLVGHAVNNEELATQFRGKRPFDDQTAALAQLDAVREFAERHSDFMALALSPSAARSIIEGGRLALVLGVEVDALGKCRRDDDCTRDEVRAAIDQLYEHGARHIFPIHLADNALGGSAVYNGLFAQLSWFLRGAWQGVEHDASVAFSLHDAPQSLPEWLAHVPGLFKDLYGHVSAFPSYASVAAGHVNQHGLSDLGKFAIEHMLGKGMLVDIDHMGQASRKDSLAIAAAAQRPLVMGHTWFRDLGYTRDETDDSQKLRNEVMKTSQEVEALRALGGTLAPITNQGDIRRDGGSGVTTECAGSSSSWLQAYSYAVRHMSGSGVGLGTDFNGLAEEPLPRFGPAACLARGKHDGRADNRRRLPGRSMSETLRADAEAQDAGVSYATSLGDAHQSRFLVASASKPYGASELALWVALAAWESKQDPRHLGVTVTELPVVLGVVAGLSDAQPHSESTWRHAAFLVKSAAPEPSGGTLLHRRYSQLEPIHRQWQRMKSGNPTAPLERSRAGHRDYDYNIDGLAHYGLLPDFLQDVSNQLRRGSGQVRDLSALFRSAESYVAAWERAAAPATP